MIKVLSIFFLFSLFIADLNADSSNIIRDSKVEIKTRGSGGKMIKIKPKKNINIFKSNLEKK